MQNDYLRVTNSFPRFPELNSAWENFDMTDIAGEIEEFSHPKESTPIGESASLECNFPGCPEKKVFSKRSALKYFFLYSYDRLVLTLLQETQRQTRPPVHMQASIM
jgi:hypothetical protein